MKIIAEIPARSGSQRVRNKNIKLLNGKPLICYAIDAAKKSKMLTDIYVNTDSNEIGEIGINTGIKFYKRPKHLGSDTATSDEYNYDFFKTINPDLLVQVNPVCPFITGRDIDEIIQFYFDNSCDSLVTVREERYQAFYNGTPINFNINEKLPRTQDLVPIQLCAWPVCIWKRDIFIKNFEEDGHAVFSGNLSLYPVPYIKAFKISYEQDFELAEKLMKITH